MEHIKTVTVFGASGSIGPHIVRALLAANFIVSVAGRTGSTTKYPVSVLIYETDYTFHSLWNILIGQDAVVSCIARTESETELRIIDAAEAAGVRHFLPSEYGADMHGDAMPEYTAMLEGKESVLAKLKERANANKNFTWTSMVPGPFFDYFLCAIPFLTFDITKRKAIIYDSGNAPWTGTTLASVGKAVANVLSLPAETANRNVKILSLSTTQNEILAAFETATAEKWDVQHIRTEDMAQSGRELFQEGRYGEAYAAFFASQMWEDGKGRGVNVTEVESDNSLLGIEIEALEDIVRRVVKHKGRSW